MDLQGWTARKGGLARKVGLQGRAACKEGWTASKGRLKETIAHLVVDEHVAQVHESEGFLFLRSNREPEKQAERIDRPKRFSYISYVHMWQQLLVASTSELKNTMDLAKTGAEQYQVQYF